MNIKSLLLGSAAALLAVSGARAADAVVVAEPEPMEYVRICDVYGAGFYYIPGTETCLAISGYVWYQVTASSYRGGRDTVGFNDWFGVSSQNWASDIEARVNFDARSETEWGMLRGYIRLQANWDAQNQIGTAFDAQGNAIGTFNYGGDGVTAVRGMGLWAGVDIDPYLGTARSICYRLLERGVIAKDTHERTIRLAPPLVIERDELDQAIDALVDALAEARAEKG
mgnify:CR=1 FL=1